MNWNDGFIDEDIVSSFARPAYRPASRRARACPSPLHVTHTVPRAVGRGPVPRHAAIAGDRPPRYGEKNVMSYRRARACPSPCPDLVKNRSSGAPAPERVDGKKTPRITVGRGPVPRHAAIAGDRPPRYGNRNGSFLRRARACPSPCSDRGGQALPNYRGGFNSKIFLNFNT